MEKDPAPRVEMARLHEDGGYLDSAVFTQIPQDLNASVERRDQDQARHPILDQLQSLGAQSLIAVRAKDHRDLLVHLDQRRDDVLMARPFVAAFIAQNECRTVHLVLM